MADGTQVTEAWDSASLKALFDPDTGWLDRRVLSDEGIYQLELERIFARGWNFMCHESQLKEPGEYLVSYIGEESPGPESHRHRPRSEMRFSYSCGRP